MGCLRARLGGGVLLWGALGLLVGGARAENIVTVRGVYYREQSTRVVQPMVQVHQDAPGGVDVTAHYLLDAITSASVASGVGPNQDKLLTEFRNETGLEVGKTLGANRVAILGRISREPDYLANTLGLSYERAVWGNTGTLVANAAYEFDTFGSRVMLTKRLKVYFAGLGYTQVLRPTLIAQIGYDVAYENGFLGNPYLETAGGVQERPPRSRLRHALAARLARYFPSFALGVQGHYRFYYDQAPDLSPDPWHMTAHTIELRVFKELSREVELRFAYRAHSQTSAAFWCNADRSSGGNPDCYGAFPAFGVLSSDAKFGQLATQMPEVKIMWDLRILEGVWLLDFFAPGVWELSYGYFFQSSHYGGVNRPQTGYTSFLWPHDWGGAHVLQTGYSLPF